MRRGQEQSSQQVEDRDNLALEEVTIAEVLKQAGYQTFFAGKWHLGREGHWPTDQGFDVNIGGCDRAHRPAVITLLGTIPTCKRNSRTSISPSD